MTIDCAVKQTGKSINHKQNNAWRSFKSIIDHADTTIQEKFEACQAEYETETKEYIKQICKTYGIPGDTNLAEAYALFRNQTAHGTIQKPGEVEIVTYKILRCFVYVMNMKKANVPSERITEVLRRMF